MAKPSLRAVSPLIAAVLAITGLLAACGPTITATSTPIAAAAGGVVEAPGGKGTLTIPPGSLGGDTTITLALSPATADTVSEVFDFGPDGTTFSAPATLEIPVDASKLVTGKTFSLAVQEAGAWKAIAGSTYANGKVTGAVAHFSKFTIILIDGNVVVTSSCADEIAAYQACGGDIVGTWSYQDYCFQTRILGPDPFQGRCPGFVGTLGVDLVADLTITSTTTQLSAQTIILTSEMTIPTTCFQLDGGGFTACSQISQAQSKPDAGVLSTCAEVGANCMCTTTETTNKPAEAPKPIPSDGGSGTHCVKNDMLYFSSLQPDGGGSLFILKRK